LCAKLRVHGRLIANGILHLRCIRSVPTSAWMCDSGAYFSITRSVLANQFFVIPFKDHQAGERVSLLVLGFRELDQDKGVDTSAPCLPTIHP
jgi:hypothetical protein